MSRHDVPTVTVKGADNAPLIINKSDYEADPSAWTLFDEAAPTEKPKGGKKAASVPTVTTTPDVEERDGRFFLVDKETRANIGDVAGYADLSSAWSAAVQ